MFDTFPHCVRRFLSDQLVHRTRHLFESARTRASSQTSNNVNMNSDGNVDVSVQTTTDSGTRNSTMTTRLCAGLIFEVVCKTEEEAANNERALMQVYTNYKDVNKDGWDAICVNLINVTPSADTAAASSASSSSSSSSSADESAFHRLYAFYPRSFELTCASSDIETLTTDQLSAHWLELSNKHIDDKTKKEGVHILGELWDQFKSQLGLADQDIMPLNVIGITDNGTNADTPSLPLTSNACDENGSCGGNGSCDGSAEPSGEMQTDA